MAANLALISTLLAGGTPIPGAPSLPQKSIEYGEPIVSARPDLLYMWAQPGRRPLGDAGDPVADQDCVDDRKFYVLPAASATTTRVEPTTSKLGFWNCNRAGTGHLKEGLQMVAPANGDLLNAPGYSFLTIFRATDLTAPNGFLGQGTTASSRTGFYQNTSGQLGIQHGSGVIMVGANSIAQVGSWAAAMFCNRASDRKAQIFCNSLVPTDEFTMPAGVVSQSPNFRIGGFPDDGYSANADIALVVGWLGYLPDTPGACEAIMNAALAMRALCPQ